MSEAAIYPGVAIGSVDAPSSKSYTHRFLLAAHLSGRPGRLHRPLVSADTLCTARGIERLGSSVVMGSDVWAVSPKPAPIPPRRTTVACGESGTTLRLLSAAAALQPGPFRFTGAGRLPARPMRPLFAALRSLGASIASPGGPLALPMEIRGPIHGGSVRLAVSASSQFTSALLFTLPTVEPDSQIATVGRVVSAPYVRATASVLRSAGIRVVAHPGGYRIPGGQTYRAVDAVVPGDASSAAYLWASAAVTRGEVTVRQVPAAWPQADLAVLDLLRRFGAKVTRRGAAVSVRGGERRSFRVELTDSPDLYPLAGILAALADGRSLLVGAEHVAAKESDRRSSTEGLVRALGGRSRRTSRGLAIDGTPRPHALRLRGARDHRVVMSAAVAALAAEGVSTISDAASVGKSFPGFFATLRELEVRVSVR